MPSRSRWFCATGGGLALGFVGLICSDGLTAETSTSGSQTGPRINFTSTTHDFGTVTVGEVLKHDFTFTNSGTELLVISDVQTTCGCASAGPGSRSVEPGQKGVLPIEFHTRSFDGRVAKTMTVLCNDPIQPKVTLEVRGTVWHPMVTLPASAAFVGALDSPSSLVKTVLITNKEPAPLILSPPETTHKAVAAELKTNRIGQEYELVVRLVPPLGSGNVFADVKMRTSCPSMPVLTVPVWVVAQPPVLVMPAEVLLPNGPLTNELVQTVVIRNNSTEPLTLSSPALTHSEGVQLELVELQKGRHFAARLTFPAGFQATAGQQSQLTLTSTHPKLSVIRVPILHR